MPDTNITELANIMGVELPQLQELLQSAGIDASNAISREEKSKLLMFLRSNRGSNEPEEPTRVVLSRRSFQELKGVTNAQGSNRQKIRSHPISVEIRKTRIYVKRGHVQREDADITDSVVQQQEVAKDVAVTLTDSTKEAVAASNVFAEELPKKVEQPVVEALQQEEQSDQELAKTEGDGVIAEADIAQDDTAIEQEAPTADTAADGAEGQIAASMQAAAVELARNNAAADKGAHDSNRKRKHQEERELHIANDMAGRNRRKKKRLRSPTAAESERQHSFRKPSAPVVREVSVPSSITVQDLAQRMAIKSGDLIKFLMNLGTMVTINQSLDQHTAAATVEEMGHKAILVREDKLESEVVSAHEESATEAVERPPVVTVMGHVDHGKTTLLDHIRSSNVASAEAGGITQHIGAYAVKTKDGKLLTFLDTPGHEAFSTMRARGASVTDVAVIVVAADDGVKPQTKEAIQHAKEAKVPIVVAVSKCDKEDADPARIRQQMSDAGVTTEEWGGDTLFVDVSSKTGAGIDALLESILLQSDVLELKAPAEGMARGIVLEAHMDKSLGPVATVLVQQGVLNKGDFLLSGVEYGRIRQLRDENGINIETAVSSQPVAVTGLSGTPTAGEVAMVVANERKARELASQRRRSAREKGFAAKSQIDVGVAISQMASDVEQAGRLTIVLKTDVQGTLEALRGALLQCSTDKVKVEIISSGVGSITASDINLAIAGSAFIAGFNVRADSQARKIMREENIEPHYYNVIYDLVDDVKRLSSDMVKLEVREYIVGLADVRNVFRASKVGEVAGCMVLEGSVRRGLPIRVLRDSVVVYEGELESLRHFKEDVQEVKLGSECGIGVKNYQNIQIGDQIEVFERRQMKAGE